jgi:predicted choloylglycine hydrolase
VFHPTVKGSYYDMGYRYGTVLYSHGFRVSDQSGEKLDFGRKSEIEVKRVFPNVLEEIRGFADACHTSYEQLAAFMFSIGAFKPEPMCSAFAASSGPDLLVGRNYDFYYSFKKYTESYLTCPKDGCWSLGHSDVFIGREDGVNEKGLAVAITGVADLVIKPGISFVLAVRRVLDKCANVEEAVKTLSDAHHSANMNFLLADRHSDMAVVEASANRVRVRKPEEGCNFIVCTNHFMHPEMQDMEDQKERSGLNWDSVPRYTTIYNMLKKQRGEIDVRDAQEILSNHSGYVCSHQKRIKLGTLWSVIAVLKRLQILRAEGHPCRTRYRQDPRLNKAVERRQKQLTLIQ